jgi:hypothetical protein
MLDVQYMTPKHTVTVISLKLFLVWAPTVVNLESQLRDVRKFENFQSICLQPQNSTVNTDFPYSNKNIALTL